MAEFIFGTYRHLPYRYRIIHRPQILTFFFSLRAMD